MLSDALLGAGLAFLIAPVTTPVGISGAVFLVPVQVSLLHTPSPSVTPTNLLYVGPRPQGSRFRVKAGATEVSGSTATKARAARTYSAHTSPRRF
jgi:hypothetical protein